MTEAESESGKPELTATGLIVQVSFFAFAKTAPNFLTYSHWLTSGAAVGIGLFMSNQIGEAVAKSVPGRFAATFLTFALVYAAYFYWRLLPLLPMLESRDEGLRIAKTHRLEEGAWEQLKQFTVDHAPGDVRAEFGPSILNEDPLAFVRKVSEQVRLARRLLICQLLCMVAAGAFLAMAKLEVFS